MTRTNVSSSRFVKLLGDTCYYLPDKHHPRLNDIISRYVFLTSVCKVRAKCELHLSKNTINFNVLRENRCRDFNRSLRPAEYTIGGLAIVLNLLVTVVIVMTKELRKSVAFLLISHMAFCDILIGGYAASLGNGHRFVSMGDFNRWKINYCRYHSAVFLMGQFMEAATSVFVTFERYLAIVYCMKVDIRMTKRSMIASLIFSWASIITFSAFLTFHAPKKNTFDYMCLPFMGIFRPYYFRTHTQAYLALLAVVYLTIPGLYIHIFLSVRKSSKRVGLQNREFKLAKNISVVIFSNFILFVLPNVLMILTSFGYFGVIPSEVAMQTVRVWVPAMCVIVNACINPFLFAFRNDRFLSAVKGFITSHASIGASRRPNNDINRRKHPSDKSSGKDQKV